MDKVTKEAQDFYAKNYIPEMKNKELNKWRDIPCLLIGRVNIFF